MTQNNNLSPLPIYRSLEDQDFRKPWAYGSIPALVFPRATNNGVPGQNTILALPSFFFRVQNKTITTIACYCVVDGTRYVLTFDQGEALPSFTKNGVQMVWSLPGAWGYTASRIPGNTPVYLEFTVTYSDASTESYYSEVFCFSDEMYWDVQPNETYIRLDWRCEDDIEYNGGWIPYSKGYQNTLYLNTQIGLPEYTFEEEASSRDGFLFVKKQLSEKKYKFTVVGPEYLCDALRLVRLSDTVLITGERSYLCDSFLVNISWLEQGHFARIDAEFETDTVVKRIGTTGPRQTLYAFPDWQTITGKGGMGYGGGPTYAHVIGVIDSVASVSASEDWVSVYSSVTFPVQAKNGYARIMLSVAANPSSTPRSCTITVTDIMGQTGTFELTQNGSQFSISPTQFDTDAQAGETPEAGFDTPSSDAEVEVTVPSDGRTFIWHVIPNNADVYIKTSGPNYQRISSTTDLTGSKTLVFVPHANTGTGTRASAQIFKVGDVEMARFTISQDAPE